MTLGRDRKWTTPQFQRRLESLMRDGFTPEEAFDLATWQQPLSHFVISGMRNARRRLVNQLTREGLSEAEVQERLTRRYIDLGIQGQYENEEWYVARVST